MNNFSGLLDLARHLGALDAVLIAVKDIVVKDELAGMCREPRCEGFGRSMSCPPHVAGPQAFREMMQDYTQALIFAVEVPTAVALSSDRSEVLGLIHGIAARIESTAREQGVVKAKAFAGGSCKELFCSAYAECRVLDEGKACRNPHQARPSMSGYGISVGKLTEIAGWAQNIPVAKEDATITFVGLILLD